MVHSPGEGLICGLISFSFARCILFTISSNTSFRSILICSPYPCAIAGLLIGLARTSYGGTITEQEFPLSPSHRLNELSCFDSGSLSRYLVSKLIHAAVKGDGRCEGRATGILRGRHRVKARLAQHLGNDFALGSSRVGRAVPAIARIRWGPQAALPLSGYAEDPILGRASCSKETGNRGKNISQPPVLPIQFLYRSQSSPDGFEICCPLICHPN
jgi:hypothetical protein